MMVHMKLRYLRVIDIELLASGIFFQDIDALLIDTFRSRILTDLSSLILSLTNKNNLLANNSFKGICVLFSLLVISPMSC